MADEPRARGSEIAVTYPHTVARVPFALTPGRLWTLGLVLIGLDLALVAAHVAASLPAEGGCARYCAPSILALGGGGNLPSAVIIAKLLTGAVLCVLIALTYGAERDPPPLWPLAAGLFTLLALTEILHYPVSPDGVAAVLEDAEGGSLVSAIEVIAVPLMILLMALGYYARVRPMAALAGAAILFALGHFGLDWVVMAGRALLDRVCGTTSERLGDAWIADTAENTLRLLTHSLLIIAVALAIRHQQLARVRYRSRVSGSSPSSGR